RRLGQEKAKRRFEAQAVACGLRGEERFETRELGRLDARDARLRRGLPIAVDRMDRDPEGPLPARGAHVREELAGRDEGEHVKERCDAKLSEHELPIRFRTGRIETDGRGRRRVGPSHIPPGSPYTPSRAAAAAS